MICSFVKIARLLVRGFRELQISVKKREETKDLRHHRTIGIRCYVGETIEVLRDSHSPSTKQNYITAINSLCSYAGTEDILLSALDSDFIMGYQRWMLHKGICLNTISCYLRSLRSIYNRAIKDGLIPMSDPFFICYTGKEKTRKRSIRNDELLRIRQLIIPKNTFLCLSRDLFLFSFYAQGMPFVDMAFLKKQQIRSGCLIYHRQKTGREINVKLQRCMYDIISKYVRDDCEYVFPLVSSTNPNDAYRQYLRQLGKYNRSLKQLASLAKVSENLTSYTARHSWASLAYHQNIELSVISKALGHTNTDTTMTYIREIDDNSIAEANDKILNSLGID